MVGPSGKMIGMTTFAVSAMARLVDEPVRYDLGESTVPSMRLSDLYDPSKLGDLHLGYGTSRGDADLRAAIAASTGARSDDVLITVGAAAAMFLLAQDCTGGRVLLMTPCFPPARIVPEGLGSPVDLVPLRFDDGYRLPLDMIADALTPRTRLVSLASPQNPSGVRFTEAEIGDLLAIVDERAPEAIVLVDETYRAATYGTRPVPASVAARSPRIVTCASLSKAHGVPGLRLGWLTTTDPDLYERLRNAKFLATVSCSTLDEALGLELLRREAEILAPRAERLERALAELWQWASDQPIDIVRPDGGAMCCLRLSPSEFDAEAVTRFYGRLAEQGVRVAPGSWFGADDRVFRVGFGHLAPDDFTDALNRLGAALVVQPDGRLKASK
jgi:aspartate/methionine/tyrosine aminotransferase